MPMPLEKIIKAASVLRMALEDERDQRTGLAAHAADELAREFALLNGKINRYADAARREMDGK